MSAMSDKPKRRWFEWRLSTWLVLIGILACAGGWLTSERHFIRERKDFLPKLFAKGGHLEWIEWGVTKPIPFWWREWLGDDRPVERIRVPYSHEAALRSEARRLFPEALYLPISKDEIAQEAKDSELQQK